MISKRAISPEKAMSQVLSPSAGGTSVFIGTVRNRSDAFRIRRMELEAAVDLAKDDLMRIARSADSRYGLCGISIHHRVGSMKVGEVIVVIAVSAPHRRHAFAACKYIIDELKKSTPIWKKEIGDRKQRWVEPER